MWPGGWIPAVLCPVPTGATKYTYVKLSGWPHLIRRRNACGSALLREEILAAADLLDRAGTCRPTCGYRSRCGHHRNWPSTPTSPPILTAPRRNRPGATSSSRSGEAGLHPVPVHATDGNYGCATYVAWRSGTPLRYAMMTCAGALDPGRCRGARRRHGLADQSRLNPDGSGTG